MSESMLLSLGGLGATVAALSCEAQSSRGLMAAVAAMLLIASVLAWACSGGRR